MPRQNTIKYFMVTDAQWSYIKRLMNEAFANHYHNTPNIDVHHQPRFYTKSQAQEDIKRLLESKARGWKD